MLDYVEIAYDFIKKNIEQTAILIFTSLLLLAIVLLKRSFKKCIERAVLDTMRRHRKCLSIILRSRREVKDIEKKILDEIESSDSKADISAKFSKRILVMLEGYFKELLDELRKFIVKELEKKGIKLKDEQIKLFIDICELSNVPLDASKINIKKMVFDTTTINGRSCNRLDGVDVKGCTSLRRCILRGFFVENLTSSIRDYSSPLLTGIEYLDSAKFVHMVKAKNGNKENINGFLNIIIDNKASHSVFKDISFETNTLLAAAKVSVRHIESLFSSVNVSRKNVMSAVGEN